MSEFNSGNPRPNVDLSLFGSGAVPVGYAVVLGLMMFVGCGPNSGYPANPFSSFTSTSGQLQVALRSKPDQPPTRGVSTIRYTITSGSGKAVNALTLTVEPFMDAMGHGTSVIPDVSPAGDGNYDVSNVYLPMPGRWELRTTISGAENDSCANSFEVQ